MEPITVYNDNNESIFTMTDDTQIMDLPYALRLEIYKIIKTIDLDEADKECEKEGYYFSLGDDPDIVTAIVYFDKIAVFLSIENYDIGEYHYEDSPNVLAIMVNRDEVEWLPLLEVGNA